MFEALPHKPIFGINNHYSIISNVTISSDSTDSRDPSPTSVRQAFSALYDARPMLTC